MPKASTRLEQITWYLEDAGYVAPAVKFSFSPEKDPLHIYLQTENHKYTYSFEAHWWAVASNMTDDLGREKRGHMGIASCPRCPAPVVTETEEVGK